MTVVLPQPEAPVTSLKLARINREIKTSNRIRRVWFGTAVAVGNFLQFNRVHGLNQGMTAPGVIKELAQEDFSEKRQNDADTHRYKDVSIELGERRRALEHRAVRRTDALQFRCNTQRFRGFECAKEDRREQQASRQDWVRRNHHGTHRPAADTKRPRPDEYRL